MGMSKLAISTSCRRDRHVARLCPPSQDGIALSREDHNTVVITGLGIASCLGSDLQTVTQSLRTGRSGIVVSDERRASGFRSPLMGQPPDLSGVTIPRKVRCRMGQPARYAYFAATQAIAGAGLGEDDLRNERAGLIFGNDSCVEAGADAVETVRASGSTESLGSRRVFQTMNSTASMSLAAEVGVLGANWSISAACASGAHAIGQGMMLIRAGLQDVVIVGGTQETNWQSMASFDAMNVFSTRTDKPTAASRPFDASRDGLVPSGGAGAVVLESLDHARRRGAKLWGVIRGFGFSSSGEGHLSTSSPRSIVRAVRAALADAELEPAGVEYVNAHATSTPIGDRAEARAIAEVVGLEVPVSSTKSLTGHECWMAGASELIYMTLMAADGFMAGNLNFERTEDEAPPIHVIPTSLDRPFDIGLSNSLGFGGTNACLIVDYGAARALTP